MKNLKGALLFAQSGGPTSVINSSACGVFEEAFKHSEITQVLGAAHGGGKFLPIGGADHHGELPLLPVHGAGGIQSGLKHLHQQLLRYGVGLIGANAAACQNVVHDLIHGSCFLSFAK